MGIALSAADQIVTPCRVKVTEFHRVTMVPMIAGLPSAQKQTHDSLWTSAVLATRFSRALMS